jgi:hypothetical protein
MRLSFLLSKMNFPPHYPAGCREMHLFSYFCFSSSSFPYVRTDRRSAGVSLVVLGLLRSLVIPAQLRQTKVEPIKGQGPIVYAA